MKHNYYYDVIMNNTDLSNEASFATLSCQYVLSKCTLKVITRICTEKTHEATPISVQFYLRNLKKNKTTPEIIIVVTKNKEMKKIKLQHIIIICC